MPSIFLMYPEITNIDIGTIIIFSCENSCDNNIYSEEYAYIQRTGEKPIVFQTEKKDSNNIDQIKLNEEKVRQDFLNRNIVKENNADNKASDDEDEGEWIEVKSKKTKKNENNKD